MRILFISKRRYMGKDLIDDRFGRFYELPEELAALGHGVTGLCIDYYKSAPKGKRTLETPSGVSWRMAGLWPLPPYEALSHIYQLCKLINDFKPDVIIGSSDAYHVILAVWVARKYNLPSVVDLYDQYEAFAATKALGLRSAYRRAISRATGITCVSQRLADWVKNLGPDMPPAIRLGNAVPDELFFQRDKVKSRQSLGLPDEKCILVGTAGALTKNRDINSLYAAFIKISDLRPDVHLVLAGPRDRPPPIHPRIHDLGNLPYHQIPIVFSALDIGIVCNANNRFAYYCCPQKLLEMKSCGLPVISSDAIERPNEDQKLIYRTGDHMHLAERILQLIERNLGTDAECNITTWAEQTKKLESFLITVTNPVPLPHEGQSNKH